MHVLIGNDSAIQTEGDSASIGGEVPYVPLEGERVTEIRIPADTELMDAFIITVSALKYHIAPGAKPAWIESDNKSLRRLLTEHYGLKVNADRPEGWGEVKDDDQGSE